MITDTHAHVFWDSFDEDRPAVLERAREAGVDRMIVVGTDLSTSRACFDLCTGREGLFPTAGYLDTGPYDEDPGTVETDFTRPVDPALTMDDFLDLDHTGVLTLYGGAGGGAGVDLRALGLSEISYVRITNPLEAETDIQIEAFADVAPRREGDADGDGDVDFDDLLLVLGAWGSCPDPPLPCPGDVDGNRVVDFDDLLMVLAHWTR